MDTLQDPRVPVVASASRHGTWHRSKRDRNCLQDEHVVRDLARIIPKLNEKRLRLARGIRTKSFGTHRGDQRVPGVTPLQNNAREANVSPTQARNRTRPNPTEIHEMRGSPNQMYLENDTDQDV